eukprot:scaffold2877_cov41-Cyclotella_meneghiniana.AAC.4
MEPEQTSEVIVKVDVITTTLMALRSRNSWRSGRHPAGATSGRSTRGIRLNRAEVDNTNTGSDQPTGLSFVLPGNYRILRVMVFLCRMGGISCKSSKEPRSQKAVTVI